MDDILRSWTNSDRVMLLPLGKLSGIVDAYIKGKDSKTAHMAKAEMNIWNGKDIDKVRNIEGFPIGSDEDIIALRPVLRRAESVY